MSAPVVDQSLRAAEPSAFNNAANGSRVDWTKTSLLIDGRPVVIVSAEFHYFRVPDRERWRPLLTAIKGAGFNAVRLYFHWGYHSPAPGIFNWRGNRDIDYLLNLCKELHLFVIAAPGPYICAEVQAGGFPIWLVAKRHLRIRHLRRPPIGMKKEFDLEFHAHCEDYMREIMPMLAKHERTNCKDGPIIACQIENELREKLIFGIGGLDEELRLIAEIARECGSTVPFFHNDDSPIGSWSSGRRTRSITKLGKEVGAPRYRTDMYGFDLYFTFPPGDKSGDRSSMQVGMIELCGVSFCINLCGVGGTGVGGSDTDCISCLYYHNLKHSPPPQAGWAKAGQMPPALDHLEKSFVKMGGSAANCPVICAETQVGWINQWGRLRDYDDVYSFFGPDFSATLQVSLIAQGVNIINHYMAYGGTNHGSIGDTEVYSSYDYSAFIREFGMLSGRGRSLRQISLFVRSFSQTGLANTKLLHEAEGESKSRTFSRVKATLHGALIAVRESVYSSTSVFRPDTQAPMFAFLRNLDGNNSGRFNLFVDDVVVPVYLPVNQAVIAPLYHSLPAPGWTIFASTVPVVCRESYAGSELWVLRVREAEKGRVIFRVDPTVQSSGHAISAQWASLQVSDTGLVPSNGVVRASDMDEGAATSFLGAPLEELPLSEFDMFGDSRAEVAVRASTESIGLCFSMAFSGKGTSVVAVSIPGADKPIIRFVCLTERDADTFTADISSEDPYVATPEPSTPFAAAWGVSELTFTPAQTLEVAYGAGHLESSLFLLQDNEDGFIPEQFMPVSSPAVQKILPNLFVHSIPRESVGVALRHGMERGDPLDRGFEVEMEGWKRRIMHWSEDVKWKNISYSQRDPLDHHMTSGHVAYRLRFKTSSQRASIVINVRHVAMVWCNGQVVGRQVCYSHNACSAGSMHAVDLHHAGKKRHNLTPAIQSHNLSEGFHEVIILVFSCGQSRSPFLLNDVRNKRGLLSAVLKTRGRVTDRQWYIAGVDVTRGDDSYGSSGLPLEDDANDFGFETGFAPVESLDIFANGGVNYFRSTFKVPANAILGGNVRYPLRIKVFSAPGVVAMLWVNGLLAGRYIADLGPQSDFYVPEGLIKEWKKNSVVIAAYGDCDSTLSIKVLPWVVSPLSGNLDETNGEVFAVRTASFRLTGGKGALA